jgi:hypothetical protein
LPDAAIEFNRDIRPILADHCFHCHGPDAAKRKANLRLDSEESAMAERDGRHPIVPGRPDQSELIRRITAKDRQERMPPATSARQLTDRQIDLLRRWIEQGAKWQKHWSLIPPQRPVPPIVKHSQWVRNAIDSFVLDRLEREGLSPSTVADKTTLIRRVTLDLTGLPPTPAEVDAFLADASPDAYEKVVDRLLTSPCYGERMAIRWLDAARYADTNGYQSDGERFMWRWRDWVIDAFNKNMPFDQFTVEQLAGDLLPNATLDQRIATGFNRNHRGNGEGGVIPEEYAVEYVVDRVDTTATVWLGLTMGCARCHEHKYDPIAQKEFYQVFAFFNNVPERGKAIKFGNSPPHIPAPTPQQQEQLKALEERLAAAESAYAHLGKELETAQAKWEKSLDEKQTIQWWPSNSLAGHFPFDGALENRADPAKSVTGQDGSPQFALGRLSQALACDGKRYLDAGDIGDFGFYDSFSCAAWIRMDEICGGTILSRMVDTPEGEGYSLSLEEGRIHVRLVKRWLDDALRVATKSPLPTRGWHHVLMTYDGTRVAKGIRVYVDGEPSEMTVLLDDLNQSFQAKEPFRIGAGRGPDHRFHGLISDVRLYGDALSADEAAILATPESVNEIAAVPTVQRTRGQALKLQAYFLEKEAPVTIRQAHQRLLKLRQQHDRFVKSIPTTMVMAELPTPRDSYVLIRGVYDRHGEKVTPEVPKSLGTLPAGVPHNRLGFARWLVDPANPLTARVTVNRFWQMYFGTGLVKTVEDLGTQGEWPSHPELLDWLATEFIHSGWNVKALQKLIVTSATYRQSSKITPAHFQKDPENRLLARAPRLRWPAETIRDQALAASGLLVERLGGPSVKPYQAQGLIRELTGGEDYVQDHGESLYRRSLYTFWKRTIAPPAMLTFDAAGRESCVVRETRTNTPLQALTLMNDVAFVEAARVLAERVLREGGETAEGRLGLAFRLATARQPKPSELGILAKTLSTCLANFRTDPKAAERLVGAGEARRDESIDVCELAAYAAVCAMILNLDEAITKE